MVIIKYFRYFYIFIYIILIVPLLSKDIKINEIAAIIDNEIISESELNELINSFQETKYLKQKKCQILEQILLDKILVFCVKNDKSIKIDSNEMNYYVNKYINFYFKNIGSKKELLQIFNVKSIKDLYIELLAKIENQYIFEQKKKSIIEQIDVGPLEVKNFFEKNIYNLPIINDEFCLEHIVLYPTLLQNSKNKIISKLLLIKKKIENGNSTFSEQAKIHSEDEISSYNGGSYTNIPPGFMPYTFDSIVFNLKEQDISDPFHTRLGYHIVKLEKKRGKLIDFRHILLKEIPNQEEINIAHNQLNLIKNNIENKKISFKETIQKLTNNNFTYLNDNKINNTSFKECHIQTSQLNNKEILYLSSLKEGEISEVFEDEINNNKVVRMFKLIKFYPEHKLNLQQDYTTMQHIMILEKTKNKLQNWIIRQIPNIFIKINKKYQNCKFNIHQLNIKKTLIQ